MFFQILLQFLITNEILHFEHEFDKKCSLKLGKKTKQLIFKFPAIDCLLHLTLCVCVLS